MRGYKIFSGTANPEFAKKISKYLSLPLSECAIKTFSDGEISVQIGESVRGKDIFIIQPTCAPANVNLMELLILTDALKRSSASSITAVVPYFGYARQDRKAAPRVPITAKLVANMMQTAGIDRVVTMDLHAGQIQGFFDVFKALEGVGDETGKVESADGNQAAQFFHTQAPAGHQASVDLFVPHADTPFDTRDLDGYTRAKVVDVADFAAGFQRFHGFVEGVHGTTGDDDFIDTFAVGEGKNLIVNAAFLIADDVGRTIVFGRFHAGGAGTNSVDMRRTAQGATCDGHKPDWANTDDEDGIAVLHVGKFNAMKAGRHHIGEHRRMFDFYAFGDEGEVAIRVVDVEVFAEDAVFEVREFPTGEHSTRVHGIATLGFEGIPVRSDGRHQDFVTRFEVFDERANFNYFATTFMAENHVVPVAKSAFPNGMDI